MTPEKEAELVAQGQLQAELERQQEAARNQKPPGYWDYFWDFNKPDLSSAGGVFLTLCKYCKAPRFLNRIFKLRRAARVSARLPQDVNVGSKAPRALGTGRSIGRASHNAALQNDIAKLPKNATDIRVNQQQVNAAGQRVGINRPDLQYTVNGTRYYIEYEGPANPRGAAHMARILANDPKARFLLRIVP